MGLLNFWKKKGLDQPTVPPLDIQSLNADLPSMDGSAFDSTSFDAGNTQNLDNLQLSTPPETQAQGQLPAQSQIQTQSQASGQTLDQTQDASSKSISFNVPTLDFTLPPIDDEAITQKSNSQPSVASDTKIDVASQYEDVNKLFITDEDWKEPDWANFEPYTEEKIEKPKPEDFKGDELPDFKDVLAKSTNNYTDEAVLEPAEPFKKVSRSDTNPLEIFVRGNAYGGVFTELEQMNASLTRVDAQLNNYEDMLKREEPLLAIAKEQMEYLYRKLNNMDKKIFAQ